MPVHVATEDEDLTGSGAGSITGNSSWYPLRVSPLDIALGVAVASLGGSSPALTAWLQGSNDDGVTVFDIPAALRVKASSGTAGGSVYTNVRNVIEGETSTAPSVFYASYPGVSARAVRLAYAVTGTNPAVTFNVSGLPS